MIFMDNHHILFIFIILYLIIFIYFYDIIDIINISYPLVMEICINLIILDFDIVIGYPRDLMIYRKYLMNCFIIIVIFMI
jgi:hypothetical protein